MDDASSSSEEIKNVVAPIHTFHFLKPFLYEIREWSSTRSKEIAPENPIQDPLAQIKRKTSDGIENKLNKVSVFKGFRISAKEVPFQIRFKEFPRTHTQ
ncbi:hypothetical protein AVEN_104349-1 [Araneus ventricosus]|uniref:Uncharacterized protein n=1 Tax=Araneus ventricosus TaxID=182803 RepID=A0A4Y2BWI2_ARAVE|nr:hypothetical protein AVEN_104349-1 [Araneus ventricosus]